MSDALLNPVADVDVANRLLSLVRERAAKLERELTTHQHEDYASYRANLRAFREAKEMADILQVELRRMINK